MEQKPFDVNVHELQFDDVAINDSPSYRSFFIRNLSLTRLCISIESTASYVKFQKRNENFVNCEVVSAVAMFDEVDVVNSVVVEAQEEAEVVAVFTADAGSFVNVVSQTVTCNGAITLTGGGWSEKISFTSKVFLSSMSVSPTELYCSMSSGKSQLIDFSVTNTSSRQLSFVIRLASMPSKIVDIDVCEHEVPVSRLGQRLSLEAHSTQKFFVVIRTLGCESSFQHVAVIQCDNLRDSRNSANVRVAVNVSTESQCDLVSVGETSLDFGDIYRGSNSSKALVFTNLCATDISLRLLRSSRSERLEGDVTFCIDDVTMDELTLTSLRQMKIGLLLMSLATKEKLTQSRFKFDVDILAACRNRHQLVTIRCSGTLHSSSIVVSQPNINFGDCQVGQTKRAVFTIENKSPLPGLAVVQLRSKIISLDGLSHRSEREQTEEISLAPLTLRSIELSITPQRVNPTYRKQLTIINGYNKEERFIVNVEANNMAPQETKMHDDLYSWECLLPSENQLRVVAGAPLIVPYVVRSKCRESLSLSVTTTSSEIDTFVLEIDESGRQRFEFLCQAFVIVFQQNEEPNCEQIASARDELVAMLAQRAKFIDTINLSFGQELVVYARIVRSINHLTDFQTKEDGISVAVGGVETPRFVRLSYRLCSSKFEIGGQRTKNFGDVNIGEKKTTKLAVTNKCKSFLLFTVTKSRSVTAGHIRIGKPEYDRQVYFGYVRPFATREVDISFLPGIKGVFEERLKVSNVLDSSNEVVVTVKAQVTKVDTFDVAPESWSFGDVAIGDEPCRIGAKLSLSNTSKSRREFRLKLEGATSQDRHFKFEGVEVRMQLEIEHVGASSGSSRKIEEQIEKLEQKLKIYVRKQKNEKIEVAKRRIETLKRALMGEEVELNDDQELSSSEDEMGRGKSRLSHTELVGLVAREGVALPAVGPSESISLALVLNLSRTAKEIPSVQTSSINVMIFEAKDQEINKVVPIDLTLVSSTQEGLRPTLSNKIGSDANFPLLRIMPPPGGLFFTFLDALLVPLHNTLLNDWTPFKVVISSTMETTFVVLEPYRCGGHASGVVDAKFKFNPRNGLLHPDDPQTLAIECFPKSVGPQRYIIPVKNIKNPIDVKYFCVELNPVIEEEFFEVEQKVLDFQNIITPCFSGNTNTRPLFLKNKVNHQLVLLIRSNKPQQILLFRDPQAIEVLSNPVRLAPKGSMRIYCKVVPPRLASTKARSFVGGIVIESIEQAGETFTVCSCVTSKVQAIVGSGRIDVRGASSIDLGVISHSEKSIATSFVVYNTSESFSVTCRIGSSSPNLVLDKQDTLTLAPLQERRIAVSVRLQSAGLFQEALTVTNSSCNQEPLRIGVSALKQDGTITMSKSEIQFPMVPVERSEMCWKLLHAVKAGFSITNHCAKDLILVAKTNAPISLGERAGDQCGGRTRIDAKHQHHVEWNLFDAPNLSPAETDLLQQHKLVTISTVAQIEVGQVIDARYSLFRTSRNVPSVGQIVLIPKFSMSFAMSEGSVEPKEVDVGTLGRRCKEREIAFELKNKSGVLPLRVKVVCEPTVHFKSTIIVVEPGSAVTVKATLSVDSIWNDGNFRYEVCFVNEMNGENDISSVVTGRFFRKLFQIVEEGRQDDEKTKNSITLAPLKLDVASTAITPSEMKLAIACTEPNIVLNLTTEVDIEKFAGLLSLQVLRYDAASVADTLSFAGKPQHVRLRCGSSLEGHFSRLLAAFFGQRSKPVASLTFEDIGEIEKWRSLVSPPRWVGRVRLTNSLTEDEEVDVFSSVQAVTTVVPSTQKVLVKRVKVANDDKKNERTVFQGKLTVLNPCLSHTVQLCAHACVSGKSAAVVSLKCTPDKAMMLPGKEVVLSVEVTAEEGTESNVEQRIALLLIDENVVMSGAVVRLGIAPYDPGADDATEAEEECEVLANKAADNSLDVTLPFDSVVLDLKNCTPVQGVDSSFSYSIACTRDSEAITDVRIMNLSIGSFVEYGAVIVSQSPHAWLSVLSPVGRLKAQETQQLRLIVSTAEVGTFFAHVAITNSVNSNTILLRVVCDVFALSSDGLYEINSPTGAKISAQGSTLTTMGHLFGDGNLRAVACEILNKSNVPLEFQLTVMKPARVFLRRFKDEILTSAAEGAMQAKFSIILPQEQVHQNYVVVDPKARQKLLVVGSCEKLLPPPTADAHFVVESDIVVKCKLARDTHMLKARMEVFAATFSVEQTQFILNGSSPQTITVTIRNNSAVCQTLAAFCESPLVSFESSPVMTIESMSQSTLELTVNLTKAIGTAALERGIEEHMFIYRANEPRERALVVFSTPAGKAPRPFSSSGSEQERCIHNFIRKFQSATSAGETAIVGYLDSLHKLDDADDKENNPCPMVDSDVFQQLLLELTWLVDEVQFFTNLLRNSRTFSSLSSLLVCVINNNRVLKALKQTPWDSLPQSFRILARFTETVDVLCVAVTP